VTRAFSSIERSTAWARHHGEEGPVQTAILRVSGVAFEVVPFRKPFQNRLTQSQCSRTGVSAPHGTAEAAVATSHSLQARFISASMCCRRMRLARVWYPLPRFFSHATTSASRRMETACLTGRWKRPRTASFHARGWPGLSRAFLLSRVARPSSAWAGIFVTDYNVTVSNLA